MTDHVSPSLAAEMRIHLEREAELESTIANLHATERALDAKIAELLDREAERNMEHAGEIERLTRERDEARAKLAGVERERGTGVERERGTGVERERGTGAEAAPGMMRISVFIARLEKIRADFGETCIYIRPRGCTWGAMALNMREEDDRDRSARAEAPAPAVPDDERPFVGNLRAHDTPARGEAERPHARGDRWKHEISDVERTVESVDRDGLLHFRESTRAWGAQWLEQLGWRRLPAAGDGHE